MGINETLRTEQTVKANQTYRNENVKILKDGASVRVVVIADKGGGKYEGSVAGVRVSITSKNPLKTGAYFVAQVSSQNGIIQLKPQTSLFNNFPDQVVVEQNQNVFNEYLAAFGLPQDFLSESIMCQLKQLGMAFDSEKIRKIYSMALKFKNKEKAAASIISILKEKGIDASETEIQKLLDELDLSEAKDKQKNAVKKEIRLNNEDELLLLQLKNFVAALFNTEGGKTGLLTVFNHLRSKKFGEQNWIFIPFEIVNEKSSVLGKGNIKAIISEDLNLKKLLIEYADDSDYYFLLTFSNKHIENIKMNISPLSEAKINEKIIQLSSKMNNVKVEWMMREELENTAALSEPVFSVGGFV